MWIRERICANRDCDFWSSSSPSSNEVDHFERLRKKFRPWKKKFKRVIEKILETIGADHLRKSFRDGVNVFYFIQFESKRKLKSRTEKLRCQRSLHCAFSALIGANLLVVALLRFFWFETHAWFLQYWECGFNAKYIVYILLLVVVIMINPETTFFALRQNVEITVAGCFEHPSNVCVR